MRVLICSRIVMLLHIIAFTRMSSRIYQMSVFVGTHKIDTVHNIQRDWLVNTDLFIIV